MNPGTSIPPTRAVRRGSAKRLHLTDEPKLGDLRRAVGNRRHYEPTLCGQLIPAITSRIYTVHNASQITCTPCLVEAISRGGAKR